MIFGFFEFFFFGIFFDYFFYFFYTNLLPSLLCILTTHFSFKPCYPSLLICVPSFKSKGVISHIRTYRTYYTISIRTACRSSSLLVHTIYKNHLFVFVFVLAYDIILFCLKLDIQIRWDKDITNWYLRARYALTV